MNNFIQINPKDNVCIALTDLKLGEQFNSITLKQSIPAAHKFANKKITKGSPVIKYGQIIGIATQTIEIGEWVHTHNLKTSLSNTNSYVYTPCITNKSCIPYTRDIMAYRRNNQVGIRNELWVVVTVGCVVDTANNIVNNFKATHELKDIDGIYSITHTFGCSQMGNDQVNITNILSKIISHPNAGGVLVLGLGCENTQISSIKSCLPTYDSSRIRFLNCQEVENEELRAHEILEEIYQIMRHDKRVPCKLSEFTFGMKCGGSDGYSGITANPLLGLLSDRLVKYGAKIALSEVPEMFGAEQLLMNRACNKQVYEDIVSMIKKFKNYFISQNQVIYENPSFGNKKGGITTLEEKSLGCIQKSGTSSICDVLDYGESIKKSGVSLIYGPGNDLVSTTALGAAGCQIVLFTTGRGTPFGGFIPTFKISTNPILASKKNHWIDFDAGMIINGKTLIETVDFLFDELIKSLEGKKTKNEENHHHNIAFFKQGVIC